MASGNDVSRVLLAVGRLNNSSDIGNVRTVLSKVMSLHAKGFDVREALPKIVKLLANQDLVIKKALYNILTTYSFSDPDVILLATNTLVQECSDSNPLVRGLALKTICSFNHESFLEYGIRSVVSGMKDSSAYVRRAAILSCGQLNLRSHGICQEHGLVDNLYRSIRDSDPVVMVNAIVVLEEILKAEGGIVVNKNIAHYILGKLELMTSWGISYCFQILGKYKPKSEDEMFDILNVIDPYLTHNNTGIVCSCLKLFLHYVEEFPSLKSEVMKRCFENLLSVMTSSNSEVVFCILELFESHIKDSNDFFATHYKVFTCKQKEPSYLKSKKINLLQYILTEENVGDVLDQIQVYAADSDCDLSQDALQTLVVIYQNFPVVSHKCSIIFKKLLHSNVNHVVSNCLNVLQKIDLTKSENSSEFLSALCQSLDFIKDNNGRCALLTILGNHGIGYEDAPYVLEDFIDDNENISSEVKFHLLHCCLKMFFYYPGICQHMLGKVFEMCMTDQDESLQNMSSFYYNMLQSNIEDVKHVILHCPKAVLDITKTKGSLA